eukprot:jgi/Chlat1/4538/Chrsp29S04451
MGLLSLELRPGVGIGPFTLGMPVCEAIAYAQRHVDLYPKVDINFLDDEPLQQDLLLNFSEHGFHLRFDPDSQRLRLIEVYDLCKLQLRYATSVIGGPNTAATFVLIYALLGPTFPGEFDEDNVLYSLHYPGLFFLFPIPHDPVYQACCSNSKAELPLEFPDGTTPVASRVCIFAGTGRSKRTAIEAKPPPLPPGIIHQERVIVKLGEGLLFTQGGQSLQFGASPQDAWAELGRPCGVYSKQVDTMVIHSAMEPPQSTLCLDYFYNYFTRGVDILFDGQTHTAKKFVLHTNFPGHSEFNTYLKCNFVIELPEGDGVDVEQPLRAPGKEDGNSSHEAVVSKRQITSNTKWVDVQDIMGDAGQAAIHTRGPAYNPFGPTYVYGYRHIVFEVMKNGHIASVTLFHA